MKTAFSARLGLSAPLCVKKCFQAACQDCRAQSPLQSPENGDVQVSSLGYAKVDPVFRNVMDFWVFRHPAESTLSMGRSNISPTHATCQISIRGAFDVLWTDYLGDMLLHADVEAGQVRTTTLFGQPPDLAAFIGALSLLADLGFSVIECEYQWVDLEE